MSKINAGVVVVTKFVSSSSSVFAGYIDYINRSNAVRNNAIEKYIIPTLDKEINTFNEYMGYMGDSRKTTDLFTAEKDHLTEAEKSKLQEAFQTAQDNESLMWQTVISFDNKWLAENGLYDPKTKILQEAKLKEYASGSINAILKSEGMENNSIWSAAIHYNTDNIHIHIATVQPIPQREMKSLKTLKFNSDWLKSKNILNDDVYKKIELDKEVKAHKAPQKNQSYLQILNRVQEEILKDTGLSCALGDYIKINTDGSIEISYNGENDTIPYMADLIKDVYTQKGKLKQSSIESGKSYIVNKIIQQSRNNEKIQQLMRDTIIKNMRDASLDQSPDLQQLYAFLINRLPTNRRLWQYNRNNISALRRDIDKFTSAWIEKNHPQEYKELNRLLASEQALYQTAYGGTSNEYQKNQIADLYSRLGNIVLKNLKELADSGFIPDAVEVGNIQIDDIMDNTILDNNLSEIDKLNYKLPSGSKAEFSERYQLAKKYLYGAKNFSANHIKAFELMNEEAQIGNTFAIYDLAYMFSKGLGVTIDSEKSKQYYLKALQGFQKQLANEKSPGAKRFFLYRIAKMYYSGFGVDKDLGRAFSDFEKSYSITLEKDPEGYAYSQFYLARFYENGEDGIVEKNPEKAFEYFSEVCQKVTLPHASYKVGYMLEHGIGTEINLKESNAYYAMAVNQFEKALDERPDDFIQYRLGKMYLDGKGTEANLETALYYLELSVNAGNDMAAYSLAKIYLEDKNSNPEKLEKAMQLLHLSADKNNALAQYQLGVIYMSTDTEKAMNFLTLAANQKNYFAFYQLGKIYQKNGDISKAIESFQESEKQDNYFAAYKLGIIFAKEETVFDYNKAEKYLLKATGHQFSSAEYQLGSLYLTNKNDKDSVLAGVDYLTRAADLNNEFAQYKLGKVFFYGNEFIDSDRNKAINYFQQSAAQGNKNAQSFLEQIQKSQNSHKQSIKQNFIYPPELALNFLQLMKSLGREYRNRDNFRNQQAYAALQQEIEQEKEER